MEHTQSEVSLKWVKSLMMLGVDSRGYSLAIGYNRDEDPQWNGAKPSDLLLLAAASCSSYDVVSILKKQREPLIALDVKCSGTQSTVVPYAFIDIHLYYSVRGKVNPKKLEKAIQLSMEKYCSVTNTLKSSVNITTDYEIID